MLLEYQFKANELVNDGLEMLTIQKETVNGNEKPLFVYRKKGANGKTK